MTQKTPKRSRFLEPLAIAVAGGITIKAAAESVGCSLPIAYSLSRSPEFRSLVSTVRTQSIQQAVGTLSIAANKAAAALVALLDDEDPKVRLGAVARVFAAITPMTELHELRQDVADLKEQMSSPKLRIAT